jgi:PIN domain nuclease of toxin-antitoxin system
LSGFLLDTHALIWWLTADPELPERARSIIADSDNRVFASTVSAFEIANKHRIGKLPQVAALLNDYVGLIAGQGFAELPISTAHALAAGTLTIAHRDPFDRMLIAQAQIDGLTVITNEHLFEQCGVTRLWN